MFLDSQTLKALEGGVAATWQQQQLHFQNLANASTPGYKAKAMVFDEVLQGTKPTGAYTARVIERTDTTIRPDGNNVDSDVESLELYKAYAQYSMLLDKVRGEFTNFDYVLNSNMK